MHQVSWCCEFCCAKLRFKIAFVFPSITSFINFGKFISNGKPALRRAGDRLAGKQINDGWFSELNEWDARMAGRGRQGH
jgi:hypothetical protein